MISVRGPPKTLLLEEATQCAAHPLNGYMQPFRLHIHNAVNDGALVVDRSNHAIRLGGFLAAIACRLHEDKSLTESKYKVLELVKDNDALGSSLA